MSVLHDTKLGGFALIAFCLLFWEVLARAEFVAAVSFPPFSEVFVTFWRLLFEGTMLQQLLPSLKRLVIGYLLAFVLGVALGILMGYFRSAYNLLEPITEVLRPIPSPAYIPIAILFFGLGDEMKIFMIAFASFFPILLNTYSGVRSVDVIQINTARTFALRASAILRKVIVPAASPQILTGMRISVAVALILVVISEMVASVDGIGYYILSAQRSFRVREMYAGVLTLGLLGYILNWLFLAFERAVIHWHLEAMRREQL